MSAVFDENNTTYLRSTKSNTEDVKCSSTTSKGVQNSGRKAFGRIDPNVQQPLNEIETLAQTKLAKRKQQTKKIRNSFKQAKRSHLNCSGETEADINLSGSEISSSAEDSPSARQDCCGIRILQTAKPVVDPDDSMEYENELKMLEEFYHIQYSSDKEDDDSHLLRKDEEEDIQDEECEILNAGEMTENHCSETLESISGRTNIFK